jgi:hypothetical protein
MISLITLIWQVILVSNASSRSYIKVEGLSEIVDGVLVEAAVFHGTDLLNTLLGLIWHVRHLL